MERLTVRVPESEETYLSCEKCGKKSFSECWDEMDCEKTVIDRLAAIEDILGDDYDLDRLWELVEADRDGRCVVLWAAPGTKIFEIAKTCSCGGYEEKFKYFPCYSDCVSCCEECDAARAVRERALFLYELKTPPEGLGETVFLTRDAAEAALKGETNEDPV